MLSWMAGSIALNGIAKLLSVTNSWLILYTKTHKATNASNCTCTAYLSGTIFWPVVKLV